MIDVAEAAIELAFRLKRDQLRDWADDQLSFGASYIDASMDGDAAGESAPAGQPGWCGAPGCSGRCAPAESRCFICTDGELTAGDRAWAAARRVPPVCAGCRQQYAPQVMKRRAPPSGRLAPIEYTATDWPVRLT